MQGFSEPERLWEEFFIGSRSGFHFHNTYIETAVELGVIGALVLAVTVIATLWGHLRRLIEDVRNDESYLLFGIMVLLLIRSFVEIDILTPYNVGTFLLYFSAGKLVGARQRSAMATLRRYQSVSPVNS